MIRFLRAAFVCSMALVGGSTLLAAPQYDTMTVVLPAGDQQAGRKAFVDLRCTVCHRVEGDSRFPAPLSQSQGPDLNRALAQQPLSDLAAAIIAPSHSMSVKTSEQVRKRLARMLVSPMPDYTRAMTVRQLTDLLTYLRSVGQPK